MIQTLHIKLLGDFYLAYDDGQVTTVNTLRLQSLLAYLLLHRHAPQSRSHLAFLLWPDSSEAQAKTNLRHQVHLLRQALPESERFLYADSKTLQWRPDAPFCLDVADFESGVAQAASSTALRQAIDVYRGDLLPSCYGDWILPERERLRQMYMAALERLLGLPENERDYPAALHYGQRLLQHDPLREATYRHLMRLHALNGERAGVQRVYRDCQAMLQRELGVEPSPATRQAYERLVTVDSPITQRHNLPTQLTPLVNREEELEQLAKLLANPNSRLLAGALPEAGLAINQERQHQWGMALWLGALGLVAHALGEYEQARHLMQQGLELMRAVGDEHYLALYLGMLGGVVSALGELSEAKRLLDE